LILDTENITKDVLDITNHKVMKKKSGKGFGWGKKSREKILVEV